jgi:3-hydroxyacyl-[acyl-carrier-protein] dehydratase
MSINLQKRLHHRAPYLLLDEVIEHSKKMIHAKKVCRMEEHFMQGHFPGAPIVPGAMLQEMTTQAAGALLAEYYSPVEDYDSEKTLGHALGVLRAIHHSKFKQFARPGDILDIKVELIQHLENSFRFQGSVEISGKKIMFNEFSLVNISDEKLFQS